MFAMKRRIVDRLLQKRPAKRAIASARARLLIQAYKDIDEDGSGSISKEEFVQALGKDGLDIGLKPHEMDHLFIIRRAAETSASRSFCTS